jgi:hypothetical protein
MLSGHPCEHKVRTQCWGAVEGKLEQEFFPAVLWLGPFTRLSPSFSCQKAGILPGLLWSP